MITTTLRRMAMVYLFLSLIDGAVLASSSFPAPAGVHPRILFVSTDLTAIQAKAQSTTIAPYYSQLVAQARKLTSNAEIMATQSKLESEPTYEQFGQNQGTMDPALSNYRIFQFGEAMLAASLVAWIDGSSEFVTSARQALLASLKLKWASLGSNMNYPDFFRNAPYSAYAYDLIFQHLTESERSLYRTWASAQVSLARSDLETNPAYGWGSGFDPKRLNFNWVPIFNGLVQVLSASIEGETGYDAFAADSASRALMAYLDSGLSERADALGMFKESLHYTLHGGVHGAGPYRSMSLRGYPVWSHKAWRNLADYLVYDMKPWGRGEYGSFSATPIGTSGGSPFPLALIHHFPTDPKAQWIYQELRKNQSFSNCSGHYECFFNVLWSPENPVSVSIESLSLPREAHFENNGWVYAQSSRQAGSTKFWFISEDRHLGRSHAHADRNQMGLESHGRIFTYDPGFGINYGRDHGHVKIDGIGQNYYVHKGKITNFALGFSSELTTTTRSDRDAVTVTGDAKLAYDFLALGANSGDCSGHSWDGYSFSLNIEGYCSRSYNPVQKAFRTVDFIRSPKPYLVVSDDIKKDDQLRTYTSEHMIPMGLRLETVNSRLAYLRPFYVGKYVQAASGGELKFPVSIPVSADYAVWILAEKNSFDPSNYGIQNIRIDGANPRGVSGSGNNTSIALRDADHSRFHYQRLLKNPETLSAGTHEFALGWPQKSVRLAKLLLMRDPILNPNFDSIPSDAITVTLSQLTLPTGWSVGDSSATDASLLLYMAGEGTEISGFQLEKHVLSGSTSLAGIIENKPVLCTDPVNCIAQKLNFSLKTAEPKFKMLVYPHVPGDPIPTISGSGASFSVSWPDGTRDDWGPAPISGNQPPSVAILSPASGSSFVQYTSIAFSGSASDPESGNLSSQIAWSSDLQGALGSGASLSVVNLLLGIHTVQARVTDSAGITATASIQVTVTRPVITNTAPTLRILAPSSGATFTEGTAITFSGSATDAEDGDLSSRVQWSSDKQGVLGTGASLSISHLTAGTHAITAKVTDSAGATATQSISVSIKRMSKRKNR